MSTEVGRLYVQFDADGRAYVQGLRDLDRQTDQAGRRMNAAWAKYGKMAGLAVAAGLTGAGVAMVKTAASFEYEFSRIKANANATAEELEALRQVTLQLGKDTAFSAGETAQAANELIKAGMSVQDAIGALPGMLDLAAAGELGVAAAAELTANTLSQFNLKAKDASTVADTLALAANRSTTEVSLLGQSFENGAGVASQLGWSVQETAAALAIMANEGHKGADAGTALKSALMQLMVPSGDAADIMKQYGIALYDSSGGALEAAEVIGNLEAAVKDLTAEERNWILGKVFGSYGIKAANDLVKAGAAGFRDMTEAVSQAGAAQDIAKTKMDNLMGSWEQLKGSVETLAIGLGDKALPQIRTWVDGLTDVVNEAIETGDWGEVGQKFGEVMAEGLSMATPILVEATSAILRAAMTATISAAPRILLEGSAGALEGMVMGAWNAGGAAAEAIRRSIDNDQTRAEFEKIRSRMAEEGLSAGQAWQEALKRWRLDPSFEMNFDQYDQIKKWMGLDWTEAELEAMVRESFISPERMAEILREQQELAITRATQQGMRGGKSILEMLWSPGDDAGAGLRDAAGQMADAVNEANDALAAERAQQAAEEYAELIKDLAAAFDSGVDPAEAWAAAVERSAEAAGTSTDKFDASKTSLKAWAEELQKEIQAAVDFERNVLSLMDTFGDDYDPTKLFEALSTLEPVQVEALVDGTPEEAKAVIDGLYAAMAMASDEHKESFAREALNMGEEAGGAAADTAKAWQGAFESAMRGWRFTVSFDVNGNVRIAATSARVGSTSTVRAGSGSGSRQVPLFDEGGVLPPGLHTILNASGLDETIVTAAQESALVSEIEALIAQLKTNLGDDEDLADKITEAFSKRSSLAGSFISREASRYSMYESEGAPLELLEQTLMDKIAFIDRAVAEAQAQLDAAKAQGLPQEEINDLAESLFNLRRDAAEAREDLQDLADEAERLARVPLEKALAAWNNQLGQTQSLIDILSNTSGGAGALTDVLMGNLAGTKDANLALMGASTDPDDIMKYGDAAADAVKSMFQLEKSELDKGLQMELDALSQRRDLWAESAAAQRETLSEQLSDLRASNQAELQELRAGYDARLRAMDDQTKAEDRATARRETAAGIASLYASGSWTASDVERLQALRKQQRNQERQWAREDARTELEQQRDAALAKLEEQQQAEEGSLESMLASLDAQERAQEKSFKAQEKAARDSYQAQLDIVATSMADMLSTVFAAENELLAQTSTWAAAMAGVGTVLTGAAAPTAATNTGTSTGGVGTDSDTSTGTPAWGGYMETHSIGSSYTFGLKGTTFDEEGPMDHRNWQLMGPNGVIPGGADLLWNLIPMVLGWSGFTSGNRTAGFDMVLDHWDDSVIQGILDGVAQGIPLEQIANAYRPRLYDDGGWIPPGITTVANYTGDYERVTPMRQLVASQPIEINVHVDGPLTDAQLHELREGIRKDALETLGRQKYAARYSI